MLQAETDRVGAKKELVSFPASVTRLAASPPRGGRVRHFGCAPILWPRTPQVVPHQDEEAGSIVFHSSSNASEFKNDNKEAHVTTSAAAKESEEFLDKDAEILRLIEERRSTPKEEKQRLKDLRKRIKNASEKKK